MFLLLITVRSSSLKKVLKADLKKKCVWYGTVVHKSKQWVRIQKVPLKFLSAKVRKRVAKLLARTGLCSRREGEHWVREGRVRLNGVQLASPAANASAASSFDARFDAGFFAGDLAGDLAGDFLTGDLEGAFAGDLAGAGAGEAAFGAGDFEARFGREAAADAAAGAAAGAAFFWL